MISTATTLVILTRKIRAHNASDHGMRYYNYLDQKIHWLTILLLPLSFLFLLLSISRKLFYSFGLFKKVRLEVPVIVVGNITAGGAGKSPLVMELAIQLSAKGYKPGIISRGYGGNVHEPELVTETSDPAQVGDEPLMLARSNCCPVVVCRDRALAGQMLITKCGCNLIISDDGLQHYRLVRDIEICVVDSQRKFGNGFLIPSGPLRETKRRLGTTDFVIVNGNSNEIIDKRQFNMQLDIVAIISLDGTTTRSLNDFKNERVNAVAGIANPDRFFKMLNSHHINTINHSFADHHAYQQTDFEFNQVLPVLMTQKDAVKCEKLRLNQAWVVEVRPALQENFIADIVTMLSSK